MHPQVWEFIKDNWVYLTLGLIFWAFLIGVSSKRTVIKTILAGGPFSEGTIFYYLPESLIRIKATAKVAVIYNASDYTLTDYSHIIEQTFICSAEIVSDTNNLLALKHENSPLMSDEIKFNVNSNGLLETVNITTDDRTAEVISRLAAAPTTVLSPASSGVTGTDEFTKIQESSAEFVVKASEAHEKIITWSIIVSNEYTPEQVKVVSGDIKISSSDIGNYISDLSKIIRNGNNLLNRSEINDIDPQNRLEIGGILTRPVKTIKLNIDSIHFSSFSPISVFLGVVDTSKVFNVQIERAPFVKKVNNISIQDGIIVSNEINHPSSVEGFLSIPINILKAIVTIPAQLFTFKYDNTNKGRNQNDEAPPLRF